MTCDVEKKKKEKKKKKRERDPDPDPDPGPDPAFYWHPPALVLILLAKNVVRGFSNQSQSVVKKSVITSTLS